MNEFEKLVLEMWWVSADVDDEVEEILREGRENPLPAAQAERLRGKIDEMLKRRQAGG